MLEKYLKYTSIIVGVITVVGGFVFGTDAYVIGKICFYIALLSYYYVATKKVHILLFVGFFTAFVAKYLFDKNFEEHYITFVLCYTECYLGGLVILFPLLKQSFFRIKKIDFLFSTIAFLLFIYVLIETFSLSAEKLNEYFFFGILSIAFSLFVAFCFYIVSFHNHPKKIFLFITGMANLLAGVGAVSYTHLTLPTTPYV